MEEEFFKKIVEKCPFMTYGKYVQTDVIGIVNCDANFVSMYVYNNIQDLELRKLYLTMGQTWWNESNRQLPIDVFLQGQFRIFDPYIKTFVKKEFEHILGPMTSLADMMKKRIKRKQITLDMLDD